jgi:glycerol-1-phosphate dehydrogenase [NAD(P)+]
MQLSRILTAPLVVDVRRGAVAGLGALLADQRIATEGRVAVAVGPSQGDSVLADLAPENLGAAEVFRVEDSTVDAAVHLGKQLRADAYEAVAGIGGGKTIDVTKFAAHMAGIPMVAVATNLSHDGIAVPDQLARARVGQELVRGRPAGRGAGGPGPGPVRTAPPGPGRDRGRGEQPVRHRGLGTGRGRPRRARRRAGGHHGQDRRPGGAAPAGHDRRRRVPHRAGRVPGAVRDGHDRGRVQPAGQRRLPRDPVRRSTSSTPAPATTASWPASGALFCTYLRGEGRLLGLTSACLARHGLPRTPADLGLSQAEFTKAVLHAPATRPGRYTILERLDLDERAIAERVEGFVAAVGSDQ